MHVCAGAVKGKTQGWSVMKSCKKSHKIVKYKTLTLMYFFFFTHTTFLHIKHMNVVVVVVVVD